MNEELNKVAEDIGYSTGSYLIQVALWVFVAVCAIVAVIALIQYLGTRKGEGSIITIVKNTWKCMGTVERICTISVLSVFGLLAFIYVVGFVMRLF